MLSNVTMSSGWREPTTSVPESLHHRPQYLVQHIRASMIKGADITSAMVTQTGDKAFQVQSSSNSSKYYEVTMGDDSSHEMPSCACREFQRNHLPCKHFCAVFCHCNNVSWNSLSSSYFNNPHFTIDEECVNLVDEISVAEPHEPVNCNGHSIANAAGEIEEAGKQSTELSKKGRITLKQSSKRVRELLQYITNLSYIAESVDAMEEARIQLTKTAEKLKDQCPAIETLLLELPTSKTLTPSLKRKTIPSLKDLPPRRKRRLTKKAKKTVKDLSSSVNHEKLTTDTDVSIGKFLVSKEDVVQRVKEMGKKMSSQYLESLYEKARSCGSDLGDEVQQTAMAVLDECCEEEHHEDILLQISTLAPAEMDMDSKLRLCFLLLHLLVEQGNFPLKRDLAKEKLEAEANMSGLIEALRAMRNLSSSSTLENSEERKGILAKSKNQHIDESKQKGKKRVRFNIPGCKLTSSETYIGSVRKDNLLDNLLSSEPNSLSATSVKKGRRYHVCGEVLDFKDFSTLKKPRWLNDKVINAYLSVLQREQNQGHYDHIFTMPSYMAVLWENGRMDQWMYSQVKLSLYKWIFLPINVQGNHWVLLAANIPNGTVDILDSMRGNNNALHQKWIKYMEVRSTRTGDLKDTMWRKGDLMSMQQLDGNSCGAFVMLHALVLTKGLDIRDIGHHHAVRMREFVMSKLIAASTEPPAQRAKCDMVGCSTPKKTPSVNCHVCGRWSHLTCVSLQEKPKEDFLCPICCAQYE